MVGDEVVLNRIPRVLITSCRW